MPAPDLRVPEGNPDALDDARSDLDASFELVTGNYDRQTAIRDSLLWPRWKAGHGLDAAKGAARFVDTGWWASTLTSTVLATALRSWSEQLREAQAHVRRLRDRVATIEADVRLAERNDPALAERLRVTAEPQYSAIVAEYTAVIATLEEHATTLVGQLDEADSTDNRAAGPYELAHTAPDRPEPPPDSRAGSVTALHDVASWIG